MYKYGKRTHNFLGDFFFTLVKLSIFKGVFNKNIIALPLVGEEIAIASLAPRVLLAIYHFKSNASSWDIC